MKNSYRLYSPPGGIGLYAVGTFTFKRRVVLRDIAPLRVDGGFEFLAARAVFLAVPGLRSDRRGQPGFVGNACFGGGWPPDGFGPSYPVAGLDVEPDEAVAFHIYVRAHQQGEFVARGYQLRWEESGRQREHTSSDSFTLTMTYVDPARPPAGKQVCDLSVPETWAKRVPGFPPSYAETASLR